MFDDEKKNRNAVPDEKETRLSMRLAIAFLLGFLGLSADISGSEGLESILFRILVTYYMFSIPFGWGFMKDKEHQLYNWIRRKFGLEEVGRNDWVTKYNQAKMTPSEDDIEDEDEDEEQSQLDALKMMALPIWWVFRLHIFLFRNFIILMICGLVGMFLAPFYLVQMRRGRQ